MHLSPTFPFLDYKKVLPYLVVFSEIKFTFLWFLFTQSKMYNICRRQENSLLFQEKLDDSYKNSGCYLLIICA